MNRFIWHVLQLIFAYHRVVITGLMWMGFTSLSSKVLAQDSTHTAPVITLSGYTDVYYATFSHKLEPNELQPFTTVSPRSKRFGLNVAQLTVNYTAEKIRGTVTLHYGDIAEATWSSTFRMVQEANVGFRLLDHLWLDAGFFTTHIGTESFLPKNDFLSSTAVATYNEPFFQSGARLSYEGSDIFTAQLHVVSGYNLFLDVNDAKSIGVLLSYAPDDYMSITYTNLYGRESLDDAPIKQFRFYQNLFFNLNPIDKLFLVLGGDLGTQTNSSLADSDEIAIMFNVLATVRYQFTSQYALTIRGEIFQDEYGFISGTFINAHNVLQGLELTGITLGAEYKPTNNAYIRIEGRNLSTDKSLLLFDQGTSNNRLELMITAGFYFDQKIH